MLYRSTLLALAFSLAVSGCQDDESDPGAGSGTDTTSEADSTGADTTDDTTGDTSLTDILADVTDALDPNDAGPDTADTGPVTPTSGPRAYVIEASHTDDLAWGPLADARVGDVVIANDHVRFVVRGGDAGLYLSGSGAGGIVDAGTPTSDRIEEVMPIAGFNSFGTTTVSITENGADGVAEVVVSGPAKVPDIVNSFLFGLQLDSTLTQTYRLEAGSRSLEMTAELDVNDTQQMGEILFLGGDLDLAIDPQGNWLASSGPEVSYGLVADESLDLLELGGITLILGPEAAPPVRWTRWLVVGDGSLSSVMDQIFELRAMPTGTVSGTIESTDDLSNLEVSAMQDGKEISRFRLDESGNFAGKLPVGFYTLVARGAGRPDGAGVAVDVLEGQTHTVSLSGEPASGLEITTPMAIRLSLNGEVVPIEPGTSTVPLPPGTWNIVASRGFEWEIDTLELTLTPGETAQWSPTLVRSVDTAGWIASDFHLHSEWSPDSSVPLELRVLACAAEGIEYAVATDHDVITDYSPRVPTSIKDDIAIGIGVEVSTGFLGHINVWPLVPDPDKTGRGAPSWHGLTFGELMDVLAPETPGRVVQINHGRGETSSSFDAIAYDPEDPDPETLADMRFTAMELLNSGGGEFPALFTDFLSLQNQGQPVAGTGVSDAHGISSLCGHARTLVEVSDDNPSTVVPADINSAVRARRTLVTSGPFVTLVQNGTGTVHIRVAGPSWMPIDTITVYANGEIDQTIEVPAYDGDVIRFDDDVLLNNEGASLVNVLVTAKSSAPPVVKHAIRAIPPTLEMQ